MASAWAQLSKSDQDAWKADGMDKATYNEKYGKGGTTAPAPPSPQQEAAERAQNWSELSKPERQEQAEAGVSKKDYNRSTGTDSPSKWDIKSEYARNDAPLEDYQALDAGGTVTDENAQKFLDKKIRQLTPEASPEPTPTEPTPTEPTPTEPTPTPTPEPSYPATTPVPSPTVPKPYNPIVKPPKPSDGVFDDSFNTDNTADVDQTQQQENNNSSTNIIDGNYNTINNQQYNFGGDQTTNIWQSGAGGAPAWVSPNGGVSTYASDKALARSTDYDSPGSTAEFAARHAAINDMLQSGNSVPNYAQMSIDQARQNRAIDIEALDKRISQRPLYSGARGDMLGLNLFGDMYRYQAPDWSPALGTGGGPKDDNLDDIYDDIMNEF